MSKVLELQEEKGRIVNEMRSLTDKADTEKRSLTSEEDTKYDKLSADLKATNKRIEREIEIENESRSLAEIEYAKKQKDGDDSDKNEEAEKRYEKAFDNYLRRGLQDITKEDRAVLMEKRAQSTTGSEGGYTIPRGFNAELERVMKTYGPMLEVGKTLATATGNQIDWPTIDDTSNKGRRISEGASHKTGQTDLAFGTASIKAYAYSSGIFLVSNALLQDSEIDLSSEIVDLASERLGRILNEEMTTGAGSTLPQGVVVGASASGITAAAAALTFDNVIDVYHSLNSAYRNAPGVGFMFNDNTAKALRKLKDGQGNYLWQMGDVRAGIPDSILGKPYYVNDDMADIGASAKSLIFGNLKKYLIRKAKGFVVRRLDELFAETDQTAFVVLCRYDGAVLQSKAIKSLVHAAS